MSYLLCPGGMVGRGTQGYSGMVERKHKGTVVWLGGNTRELWCDWEGAQGNYGIVGKEHDVIITGRTV